MLGREMIKLKEQIIARNLLESEMAYRIKIDHDGNL